VSEYYFDSSDGCELCAAMEGWYEDEPPRPHENCDCDVETPSEPEEVDGSSWFYDYHSAHGPDGTLSIIITVTVECFNGRTIEDVIDVEIDESEAPELTTWEERMEAEAEELANSYAEEMAESCGANNSTYTHIYEVGDPTSDPESSDEFSVPIHVEVDCGNGRHIEDDTELEFEVTPEEAEDIDPFWDWIDDQIEDAAREAAEELSESCPEPDLEGSDVDDDFAIA
jgi:hypothetical protein